MKITVELGSRRYRRRRIGARRSSHWMGGEIRPNGVTKQSIIKPGCGGFLWIAATPEQGTIVERGVRFEDSVKT